MDQRFSFRSIGRLALVSLALLSAAQAGPMASITLRNGDHLTAEIIDRADGLIYIRSTSLGYFAIREGEATITPVPEIAPEALVGLPPEKPAPSPEKKAVPAAPVAATPPPAPDRWKLSAELGFTQSKGRINGTTSSLRFSAERTKKKDNYLASASYLYGEQSDVPNTDLTNASFRWRHDLTDRTFSQSTESYLRDKIAGLDSNIEQNISLGHRFIDKPRHTVNMGAGFTGRYRAESNDTHSIIALAEVFEEYVYKINGLFTLNQNFRGLYSPQAPFGNTSLDPTYNVDPNAENFKVIFNSTLQGKITARLSMNIRFEHEFDNSINKRDAKTDQRITSSLGYSF